MSGLDRKLDAYRAGTLGAREARKLETRIEADPELARRLRASESLGNAIRESWNDGPAAPSPEMMIAALRPEFHKVDRELDAQPGWLHFFDSARQSVSAVPGFALAAACALAMLYFVPAGTVPNPADTTAAASVTEMQVETPVYPIYDLAGEKPLMILEGEDGSTVIWILDSPDELSRLGIRLGDLG